MSRRLQWSCFAGWEHKHVFLDAVKICKPYSCFFVIIRKLQHVAKLKMVCCFSFQSLIFTVTPLIFARYHTSSSAKDAAKVTNRNNKIPSFFQLCLSCRQQQVKHHNRSVNPSPGLCVWCTKAAFGPRALRIGVNKAVVVTEFDLYNWEKYW